MSSKKSSGSSSSAKEVAANSADKKEWQRLQNIDPTKWTVADVGVWLQFLDLGEYRKKFIENAISGSELSELEAEDLAALGVRSLGHRKRILKEIARISPKVEVDEDDNHSDSGSDSGSVHSESSGASSSKSKPEYIPLKCYYKKKVAVLSVKENCTLEKLKEMVRAEFHRRAELSYEDSDGDQIPLKKDSDLQTALRTMTPPIRITCSRKRRGTASSALTDSETGLLEAMLDAMIVIDAFGNILFVNSATENLLGHQKKDLLGQNVKVLMPPVYAVKHDNFLSRYRRTGEAKVIGTGRSVMAQHSDGSQIPVHLSLSESKDKSRHIFTGTLRRIAGGVGADGDFEQYAQVQDPVIIINQNGIIEFFNNPAKDLFGYTAEEVVGQNVKMLMPHPHTDNHDHYLHNYLATGQAKVIGKIREVIIEKSDGNIVPVYLSVEEKVKADGTKRFIGMMTNRKVEKNARNFLQEQRRIVNELQVPAIICNQDGLVQAFNSAASKLLGYDLSDVLGQNVSGLMPEPHCSQHDKYIKDYLDTGVAKVIGSERVLFAKHANGEKKRIKLTVTEVKNDSQRLFIGMLHGV